MNVNNYFVKTLFDRKIHLHFSLNRLIYYQIEIVRKESRDNTFRIRLLFGITDAVRLNSKHCF